MAFVCSLISAARRGLRSHCQLALIGWRTSRSFSEKVCDSNSLLIKRLLQEPSSLIKTTLNSHRSSHFLWESLLTSFASFSSPNKARLVLEWRLERLLKENERNHDFYCEIISLCGKIRDLQLAMSICTSMEAHGITLNSAIFNSLIHVCFSSNNVLKALSLFEIMENSEDFKPNSDTFEAFVYGFSKLGNVDAMKAWYSAKKAAGHGSHLQTYESLISGCIKSRHFESADKFFEEMLLTGLGPNLSILECMLEGFCKRRSFDQLKEFVKLVFDGRWRINEHMAEKLVGVYSELGKVEEMEELLATLVESGQVLEVLSVVHCGIIRMYAMLDRLDAVEYAVGRMLKQGLSFRCSEDVEKVICSYFRREAYDRLDLFLERVKCSYEFTRSTYDLLIAGYRRARLSDKLDLVMNDMKLAGFL